MRGWNEDTCNSEGVMKAAGDEINLGPCSVSSFDITVLNLPVLQPEAIASWCSEQYLIIGLCILLCVYQSNIGRPPYATQYF
jgi:hypothetical protein